MNRVHITCLFAVLFFVISPSLTAPADNEGSSKNNTPEIELRNDDSNNEIEGNINRDTENISPENDSGETSVTRTGSSGVSTGIITRVGPSAHPFECGKITCPYETQTCEFKADLASDGKTAEVKYKCFSSNGTLLHEETKTEEVTESDFGGINLDGFFSDFTRRMNSFFDDFFKNFRN